MTEDQARKLIIAINNQDIDYLYQRLIDDEYFTEDELRLVTDVAGYSLETLNDCIYSRCGYRDFEQLYDLNTDENDEDEE